MKALDLTGWLFGRLTAVRSVVQSSGRRWECRCECGGVVFVTRNNLRSGHTVSCGCLRRETGRLIGGMNRTHGLARHGQEHPLYATWVAMWARCTNPQHRVYGRYGGRGIAVSERWRDFTVFLADMGEKPSSRHSLDRIDNDGNYEPGNCRWATPPEQRANRRPARNERHRARTTVTS